MFHEPRPWLAYYATQMLAIVTVLNATQVISLGPSRMALYTPGIAVAVLAGVFAMHTVFDI
jgi:hypothetical protein